MRPVTIGTAGHIDHGKSALVQALTGINPDRLAEEQRRGMTLDLGFAHLDLPGGQRIGIIDVPGHEALIHNMLAGAGGIDFVMLVVAADEGVMPQTREHLDILRFLPVCGGVVALTKTDLVSDPEWLAVVEEDVRSAVAGTPLETAPVIRVSARTGAGLPALVSALDRLAAAAPPRRADGPARLPVDRSFTIHGFGTVVTGTLWTGTIRSGDVLRLLPGDREVRVRGLEVHGQRVDAAQAGSRVAANLVGIDKDEARRGDVLATPGAFVATDRLDARMRLLPGAPAVTHATRVHFHLGAGEAVARIVMVDGGRLEPGGEALVQIRLERPVVAVHGDRFVVRRYSPTRTIGGGVVVQVAPPRRRRVAAAEALRTVEQTGPQVLIIAAVARRGRAGLPTHEVASASGLDAATAQGAVASAQSAGTVIAIGERFFAGSVLEHAVRSIEQVLADYHARTPWRAGMPREELKARVAAGPDDRLFDYAMASLTARGVLSANRGLTALAGHAPRLTTADQRVKDALAAALERAGVSPPSLDELRRLAEPPAVDRMLTSLLDEGTVLQVTPDLWFAATTVEAVRGTVVETLRAGGDVTVAALRDRLRTSRRYALALLEYFDAIRVTRRIGDRRVLGPRAGDPLGTR